MADNQLGRGVFTNFENHQDDFIAEVLEYHRLFDEVDKRGKLAADRANIFIEKFVKGAITEIMARPTEFDIFALQGDGPWTVGCFLKDFWGDDLPVTPMAPLEGLLEGAIAENSGDDELQKDLLRILRRCVGLLERDLAEPS